MYGGPERAAVVTFFFFFFFPFKIGARQHRTSQSLYLHDLGFANINGAFSFSFDDFKGHFFF